MIDPQYEDILKVLVHIDTVVGKILARMYEDESQRDAEPDCDSQWRRAIAEVLSRRPTVDHHPEEPYP